MRRTRFLENAFRRKAFLNLEPFRLLLLFFFFVPNISIPSSRTLSSRVSLNLRI